MHNGGIPGFGGMKRKLLALLGDAAYKTIEGTTDSEVLDETKEALRKQRGMTRVVPSARCVPSA